MRGLLLAARTLLQRRDFVVVLACNLLVGLASSFVAPFFSMYGTLEVGMKPMVFGLFMTVTSGSAIVASTALARWSDTRWSRRSVLILGSITGMLGYIGYAFVRDVVWLTVIGCVALGISSITFSQLFAYARELIARSSIKPTEAPLYMNVFRLFFALSWTVGPAIASWVMVKYSYEGTFLVAAACFLVLLVAVLRYIPAVPPLRVAAVVPAPAPLGRSLVRPDLLAHFVGFVLVFASTTMSMMNLPLLVLDALGGNERHVGVIYSLAPVFELPFMVLAGMLASRGDQARLIRIAVGMAVVYYGLLALVQAPWHIYPLQVLSAAITAVTAGVAITFFQNFLPDQVGTATNLYANAQRVGSTAGYLLFGVLVAALGHRAVFWFCAGACALSLGLLFAYRPESSGGGNRAVSAAQPATVATPAAGGA